MPTASPWVVEFFADDDGSEPVKDYLLSIRRDKERALLLQTIERLHTLGPEIQGTKMDKLIDGPIRELRKDRHRILYGRDGNTFVLLSAFLKSTQATPRSEIELAKRRFELYQAHYQKK